MINRKTYILIIALLLLFFQGTSQVINLGVKVDKDLMFQAGFNVPILWKEYKKFDIAPGLDYTTPNRLMPSGLQPQITGLVYIVDNKNKEYLMYGALTAGYLFDFNKEFKDQFRLSPHLYLEYMGLLNIKIGYDYMLPLQKGFPYLSVGFGGLFMFRHFKVM